MRIHEAPEVAVHGQPVPVWTWNVRFEPPPVPMDMLVGFRAYPQPLAWVTVKVPAAVGEGGTAVSPFLVK
jgi:hypothetical protein